MITIDGKTKNVTGEGFRLVHDRKRVVMLIEGTEETITSTKHEVEEFKTEQEALDWIKKMGLGYNPPVEEEYA